MKLMYAHLYYAVGLALGLVLGFMLWAPSEPGAPGEKLTRFRDCEIGILNQILEGEKSYVDFRSVHLICLARVGDGEAE